MDKKELKREIIRMYAKCNSYILQIDSTEKGDYFITKFLHPKRKQIIEVTETTSEIKCVLVYNKTTNAMQRNSVEIKTIEQFRKAIS